jgi:hypothetical protein
LFVGLLYLFFWICWFLLGLNFWWVAVTFRSILDIPIRHLDLILPEAKTSILAASSGLCTKRPLTMTMTMTTAIVAQDDARLKPTVKVAVSGCKRPRTRRHAKQRHKS